MKENSQERFERIKIHFENEAKRFDKRFFKVIPFYQDVIGALMAGLPYESDEKIRIIDLGCGTGNITQALLERYPRASVTCIDMAENMLAMAREKLKKYKNVEYWLGDLRKFKYTGGCHVVISSLVMHHVEERQKKSFYQKIFNSLRKDGVLYNADIVLGSGAYLQSVYYDAWKAFMRKSLSARSIQDIMRRHSDEDRPTSLMKELDFLRAVGFRNVDVVWKYYNFAVYGGQK